MTRDTTDAASLTGSCACCRAKDEAERRLQEAVQQAEAGERSAAHARAQLEESGRRHAAAAASFEVCFAITHAGRWCWRLSGCARAWGRTVGMIAAVLNLCTAEDDR